MMSSIITKTLSFCPFIIMLHRKHMQLQKPLPYSKHHVTSLLLTGPFPSWAGPMVICQHIDDNISLLRNLIAYEQCTISSNHITSYPILLKSLIRSSKDIKILRQRRIINSNWIDDEVYLAQCHSILDEVVVKDFYFADLCNQVNAYARKFWFRRRLKSLYRTYFSTAWSFISFIAALCLFVLTVIQTYYAIHHR